MTTKTSTTVLRAMELLDVLAELGHGSVREVAARAGVASASAHRMLLSLQATGMVERDAVGGYRLATHLLSLASRVPVYRRLQVAADRPLCSLTERVRLPAVVSLRDRTSVLYAMTQDAGSRRPPSRAGDVRRMHCTASGKVLLAHSDDSVLASVVAAGLTYRTMNTVTDSVRLVEELAEVRRAGVAVDKGEEIVGWSAVAAPVYGPTGTVEAALALCAPRDSAELIRVSHGALLRAADAVTRQLTRAC